MSDRRSFPRLSQPACQAAQALARILAGGATHDVCVASVRSRIIVHVGDAARELYGDPGASGAVAYWGSERDAFDRAWVDAAGPLAAMLLAVPALYADFGSGAVCCGPAVVVLAAPVTRLPNWGRVPRDLRLRRLAFVPGAGGIAVELPVRAASVAGVTRIQLPLTSALLARCHGTFPPAFAAAAAAGDGAGPGVCIIGRDGLPA